MKKRKTPAIRFKGFTEDWEQRKLGEVCNSFEYGLNAAAKEFDGINKYIRITDIDDDSRVFLASDLTSPDCDLSPAEKYKLQDGDIVFARTGASVGKTFIYNESDGLVYYAGFLIRAKINANSYPDFVFYNTLTKEYEKFIRITSQRSGQPGVNAQEYSNFEFSLPSYEEQKRIGHLFRNLDNLIILHQRKLSKLNNFKKSCLENMFPKNGEKAPKIRFKGFTDAWEQRKFGDIGTTYTGLSGKTKEDFGHGNGKFITYMNVFTNPVSLPEMTESVEIDDSQNKVQFGDVLFTTSSETPEEVGMSSVWLENSENTYLNSFCFGYRPTIEFNPYYLAYMFRSNLMRKKIIFLAQGISRYNISKNKMMDIEIPLPNIEEQTQIGEYFRNLDSLITLHQHKYDKLVQVKKALLSKMFV